MQARIRTILTWLVGISATSVYGATELKVATFNVAIYGLGGEFSGTEKDEYRDPWLAEFFESQLGDHDVVAFQEIVDVARLQTNVLPEGWKCTSYDSTQANHQKVALCLRRGLTLGKAPGLDGYTLDDVAMERLRPAVVGVVKNQAGSSLAIIAAIHLKAGEPFSETRTQQVQLLAAGLKAHRGDLPLILLGDANTHGDDAVKFTEVLNSEGLDFALLPNRLKYTFRIGREVGFKFDHIWASRDITVSAPVDVFVACNTVQTNARRYEDTRFYNRLISDHCPVKVKLRLPSR